MTRTPIEIAQLKAENAAIDAEIAKLELRKLEIAEKSATPAPIEQEPLPVRWVNTDNMVKSYSSPVIVHGAECEHLETIWQDPYVKCGLAEMSNVEHWKSAKGFAHDYNEAFYNEEGLDGCWDITFYPCTGLVDQQTTMTGFEN